MALTAISSIASLTNLSGIMTEPGSAGATTGGAVSLAGFDVVVQMSRRLLQSELEQSLAAGNLAALSAYVPWGSVAVPASLLATMSTAFRLTLSLRPARLELRLVGAYLADFHWPPPNPVNTGGGTTTTANLVLQRPTVDVGWQVEINILTPKPVATQARAVTPSTSGAVGSQQAGNSQTATTGQPSGSSDAGWDRTTLVSGNAVTSAFAELVVPANLWRFFMELDFSNTSATVTSNAAAVTDFVAGDAGRNMLSQALAPLKAAAGIQLTPEIAPAGAVSAGTVQARSLPPFTVQSVLLSDAKGNPILCLCAQLAGSTGGVARLVTSFLNGKDFAYGVSTRVLSPALKTQWSVAATGLTITGITPVDLPQGDGKPDFTGQAQLRISFSNMLDDVSIVAATDNRGDPVRLLSTETIQLLNLWDQDGNLQTNLGPLAQPQTAPLLIPVCLFASGGDPPNALQAQVRDFIAQLLLTMAFPILDPFAVDSTSISGFASSAMQTLLVRWALMPLLPVSMPGSGGILS
uniref:Uncharacterized protein n=1 Tax=Solibacter usitatus (strain Ellin6076) TaxID=234267 RepID=Q01Y60_SOLUE